MPLWPSRPALRIVIADDHELLREGLIRLLSRRFPDSEIVEAGTGAECLALVNGASWDVVILDIQLPDRNGIDLLQDIRLSAPDLPVVILSGRPESDFGLVALRTGAFGFLSKTGPSSELVEAIGKAVSGHKHISSALAERLLNNLGSNPEGHPHEGLSARELQVLIQLGTGRTVSQIGRELSLSVKTVSTYRTRVLEKMGMSSTPDLMRYVLEHHLAE